VPVISPIDSSFGPGIVPGSAITVAAGTAVVFAHKGAAMDVLTEGVHSVDSSTLPELAKRVNMQTFGARAPIDAAGYVVSLEPVTVDWDSGVMISMNRQYGLTFSTIAGRATFQVSNPAAFVTSMLREASELGKVKGDKMAQLFPTFLKGKATKYSTQFAQKNLPNLGETLAEVWTEILVYQAVQKLKINPSELQESKDALYQASGQAIAGWMYQHGATLAGFSVDKIGDVRRAACVQCKSETAPTAYAIFRRNISLFYVRFNTQREGNFCVPCALKASALDNCVMLVAGWWGIIGLVLSPCYFVLNIVNFIGVLTAKKASTSGEPNTTQSSWPSTPSP